MILQQSFDRLEPKGLLVCEIGSNRKALERAFPQTPFAWPQTAAGTGQVFLLSRADLPRGENCGVTDGTRTHNNWNHNPGLYL